VLPEPIPAELPQKTQAELFKTAAEIRCIAQLTRFIIEGKGAVPFRPYDVMLIALARGNPEDTAWGPYGQVDGLRGWGHIPKDLRKTIEKIEYTGINLLMSDRGIGAKK